MSEQGKKVIRVRIPLLSGECIWCDDGWPLDKWEKDHHYISTDGGSTTAPCRVLYKKNEEMAHESWTAGVDVGPNNKIIPIVYGKHVIGKNKPIVIYDEVEYSQENLLWMEKKAEDSGYIWGKGMEPLSNFQDLKTYFDKGTEEMKKSTLGLFGAGFAETVPLPEIEVPIGGELMADSPVWINRFTVPSSDGKLEYVVSQNRKGRWWACSCPGCKNNQHCKHLAKLGLPGDHEPHEARVAITPGALPKTVLRVAPDAELPPIRARRRFSLPDEEV